ncbi:MAG: universal stress protein, partial [Deltaproteobacteria bacterium]|nr:universal stress protein [Deltaproteobacteria bacterium]
MWKRILVVTDFSPNSLKVVGPALAIAQRFGGVIHLCHVDEEEQALSAHSSDELVAFLETVEARRTTWLENLANQIREHEVECEVVRLKGWASREILRYSEEADMDLVAISALGTQGFKALLMGSTSTNVLRNCPRPILFVSAHCHPADDFEISSVLYPTDFSEISVAGARDAARLCRETGAKLELFHVLKVPTYIPALPGEPPLVMPPRLLHSMDSGFDSIQEDVADLLSEDRIGYEIATSQDEAEAICNGAVGKKCDLIVITRRGQGVLDGLLFGRVAENVARLAPVPP